MPGLDSRTTPPTKFEKEITFRRRLALGGSGFLIITGVFILCFAAWRFFSDRHGIGLVVPGCSLIGAGVASGVATLGVVSWAEQRERDLKAKEYEHREMIYERLAQNMVAQFGGSYDHTLDAQLRATAALWASQEVVERLADWQQDLIGIVERSPVIKVAEPAKATRKMSAEDSNRATKNLGAAIAAMRMDLIPTSTKIDGVTVLRSIFNQEIPSDLFTAQNLSPDKANKAHV